MTTSGCGDVGEIVGVLFVASVGGKFSTAFVIEEVSFGRSTNDGVGGEYGIVHGTADGGIEAGVGFTFPSSK